MNVMVWISWTMRLVYRTRISQLVYWLNTYFIGLTNSLYKHATYVIFFTIGAIDFQKYVFT